MTLTLRWWERAQGSGPALSSLSGTTQALTALQPTLNASATLLRTRCFPMLTLEDSNVAISGDRVWDEVIVFFLAWYDENGTGAVPQPDDLDPRIVMTSRLYPQRWPSLFAPAVEYHVTWTPPAGIVESFGQRKPNPATLINPQVNFGFWVNDPSFTWYTSRANQRFVFSQYNEALFGV